MHELDSTADHRAVMHELDSTAPDVDLTEQ